MPEIRTLSSGDGLDAEDDAHGESELWRATNNCLETMHLLNTRLEDQAFLVAIGCAEGGAAWRTGARQNSGGDWKVRGTLCLK
jgi:hypothetical protein